MAVCRVTGPSRLGSAGRADEDLLEAHVGLAIAELRRHLREGSVGDLVALLEDQDVRAYFLEQMQQVGAQDNGGAVPRATHDRVLHPADAERIEPQIGRASCRERV